MKRTRFQRSGTGISFDFFWGVSRKKRRRAIGRTERLCFQNDVTGSLLFKGQRKVDRERAYMLGLVWFLSINKKKIKSYGHKTFYLNVTIFSSKLEVFFFDTFKSVIFIKIFYF